MGYSQGCWGLLHWVSDMNRPLLEDQWISITPPPSSHRLESKICMARAAAHKCDFYSDLSGMQKSSALFFSCQKIS